MKKSKKQRKQQQESFDPSREVIYRARVWKSIEEGNFRHAAEEIDHVLRCNPGADVRRERTWLYIARGNQLAGHGDHRGALEAYEKARALSGSADAIFEPSVRCLLALGETAKALDRFADDFHGGRLSRRNAGIFLRLLAAQGRLDEAATALAGRPESFDDRDRLWMDGIVALREGRAADAAATFERLQAIGPEEDPSWPGRMAAWQAYTLMSMGEEVRAAGVIERIAEAPLRGWLFLHHHHGTGSPESLEHARRDNPEIFAARKRRDAVVQRLAKVLETGSVHDAAHELEEIEKEGRRFPGLDELAESIYFHGAEDAVRSGEAGCAIAFQDRLLELRPHDLRLRLNILVVCWPLRVESFPKVAGRAVELVDQAATTDPQAWPPDQAAAMKGEIAAVLGLHHMYQDKPLRARAEAQKAERDAPSSPYTLLLKGRLAGLDHRLEEAVGLYEQAVQNGLEISPPVYDEILDAYQTAGADDLARQFRKRHGARVGDAPETPTQIETRLYFALYKKELLYVESVLEVLEIEGSPMVRAASLALNASDSSGWQPGKKGTSTLSIEQAREFLNGFDDDRHVIEALQLLSVALRLFRKSPTHKKLLAFVDSELATRAESSPAALKARLNVAAALREKPADFKEMIERLLRLSERPADTLVDLYRFAMIFRVEDRYGQYLLDWLKHEPEHPGLLWAVATIPNRYLQNRHENYERGYQIARKLQDAGVLELFRLEEFLNELEDEFATGKDVGFEELDDVEMAGVFGALMGKPSMSIEKMLSSILSGATPASDPGLFMQFVTAAVLDPEHTRATLKRMNAPPAIRRMVDEMIRDVDREFSRAPKLR